MDINHPLWEAFEAQFDELAFLADDIPKASAPPLGDCRLYLTKMGENGLSPEEEMTFLAELDTYAGKGLQKIVIDTGYWQNVVLFVP